MDQEFMKYLASLGVGGIIAGLMFMIYRKDVKLYMEQWRGQSEILLKVIMENTASNIKLISLIETIQKK